MGAGGGSGAPLTTAEFRLLMDAHGPFEAAPRIAVALSGGPDSMALTLLLADWVGQRGGELLALTVDHGLRAGSGEEAARAAAWMQARGVAHRLLTWQGEKPATGLHEAARTARYGLLAAASAQHGILHLALGHQADDQAETVAIRRARDSGPDGLAGMPAIREMPGLRLIRPLLCIPRARLAATCAALGQPVIQDPSNLDPRFARGRLRQAGGPAVGSPDWQEVGRERAAAEDRLAGLLARHADFHPEGWVDLDPTALAPPLGEEEGTRLLARLLGAVAGRPYPARRDRLAKLWCRLRPGGKGAVQGFRGASLGGCVLVPGGRGLRIVREERGLSPPVAVGPGGTALWDQRFRLRWGGARPVTFGALGAFDWRPSPGSDAERAAHRLPAAVRRTLPAIAVEDRVLIVPHLSHVEPEADGIGWSVLPESPVPAAGSSFSVVLPGRAII